MNEIPPWLSEPADTAIFLFLMNLRKSDIVLIQMYEYEETENERKE